VPVLATASLIRMWSQCLMHLGTTMLQESCHRACAQPSIPPLFKIQKTLPGICMQASL
jgi:hypothetical protein